MLWYTFYIFFLYKFNVSYFFLQKGNFISILGAGSWLLTLLGGGLFRWGGFFQNILHAVLLGPLRIIGCFLHLHFERIIKNCAKQKTE